MIENNLNSSSDESINNPKENTEEICLVKDLILKVINESDSQPYRGDNINSRD